MLLVEELTNLKKTSLECNWRLLRLQKNIIFTTFGERRISFFCCNNGMSRAELPLGKIFVQSIVGRTHAPSPNPPSSTTSPTQYKGNIFLNIFVFRQLAVQRKPLFSHFLDPQTDSSFKKIKLRKKNLCFI